MYKNIAVVTLTDGNDKLNIVVREGGNNDWAAYYLNRGSDDVQAGDLTKLFRSECDSHGITALVQNNFPSLSFRK